MWCLRHLVEKRAQIEEANAQDKADAEVAVKAGKLSSSLFKRSWAVDQFIGMVPVSLLLDCLCRGVHLSVQSHIVVEHHILIASPPSVPWALLHDPNMALT